MSGIPELVTPGARLQQQQQARMPQMPPQRRPSSSDDSESALIASLKERQTSYCNKAQFKVGDIVRWKDNLSNRRFPSKDSVGIVTRLYDTPIFDKQKKDAGNPLFHEPLDCAIGVFDSDDDFAEFHYDSSRFQIAGEEFAAPRLVSRLQECLQSLLVKHEFHPGDMVEWKKSLKNKKRPEVDQAAVVVEVMAEPIFDSKKGSGMQYFHEPLDIKVGLLDEDDDFIVYHYDSRRLQPIAL